ncbi:uncharacterized protein LOC113558518 [Rhopalosiphum maidis]|uniref:uncharacterized protein LOC113558518 n=1 Tax=Rhopalosiphum maidis TaxID=43146 RepID=UPI000F00B5D7|nr:uncharacterized protein LOC113558518 [Rhopalosiphum maidis]
MESDLNTALAVTLIRNKPVGMDIVDYVTSVQSNIMKEETDLFFQEFLCDSEPNRLFNQQDIKENESLSLSFMDHKNLEKSYTMPQDKKKIKTDYGMSSVSNCLSNSIQKSNTCLIQPVITMKTLNEMSRITIDSGYNTNDLKMSFLDINLKPTEKMSQSIQQALDLLIYTLFDTSKLLEAVCSWDDYNNLVRYFVDLVASIAKNDEFLFTCQDDVMKFVQNTAFTILNNHHLYNSIHVEYQCNLLAKFCYDKYIRWNIINLLINRLKIDVQIVPSSCSLRSIFYTFHLIDKLLHKIDFHVTNETAKNNNNLIDLWKINHTKQNGNETETIEQMLKEWKNLLEHISMEALKKNVFLLSIRANQCLEALRLIQPK